MTQVFQGVVVVVLLALGMATAWDVWRRFTKTERRWLIALGIGLLLSAMIYTDAAQARVMRDYERFSMWEVWPIVLLTFCAVFVVWSFIPTARLDHLARWINPVGRPALNTLVLAGLPMLYASAIQLHPQWLLPALVLAAAYYASVTGRFLPQERMIARITVLFTFAIVWLLIREVVLADT